MSAPTEITTRNAALADIPAIIELAIASVQINPLPVRISRVNMMETLRGVIGKPAHFCHVSIQDGKVVGCVVAQSSYGFWFERQQCSVLMHYGSAPGAVLPLLRALIQWIHSRPVIKLAVFELEPTVDMRLIRYLKRQGFQRQSVNLTYVRGAGWVKS